MGCFDGHYLMGLQVGGPRAFHIGTCGMHIHNAKDCSADQPVRAVENLLSDVAKKLYPDDMSLVKSSIAAPVSRINGGWGDPRDHKLCRSYIAGDKHHP